MCPGTATQGRAPVTPSATDWTTIWNGRIRSVANRSGRPRRTSRLRSQRAAPWRSSSMTENRPARMKKPGMRKVWRKLASQVSAWLLSGELTDHSWLSE